VTTQHLLIMTVLYLIMAGVFVYFTRPTWRRFLGAFAGGAAISVAVLVVFPIGEAIGLWRTASWTSFSWPLLVLALLISSPIVPLVSWRVARRFGRRGLAVMTALFAIIGPPRDYSIAARFPEWITFGPGVAPVLAVTAIYAGVVVLAHAVMRVVAGPADTDPLARRPRERRLTRRWNGHGLGPSRRRSAR
jgi:hypothetical protein